MGFFENKIPAYLTDRKNTVRQLIFTSLFALVFINLYDPFDVGTWKQASPFHHLIYSSGMILCGLLIIAISRIIMLLSTGKKGITNLNYILWIGAEIISLSAVYVLLQHLIIERIIDPVSAFTESLKKTSLVLLLPYTISYLYFSWVEKNATIEKLSKSGRTDKNHQPEMIPFRDEKGDLKFSVKRKDLYYLETADNYVIIYYLDGQALQKYMIRNSMKNLETNLKELGIVRCHRSYSVNFDKVRLVRKESDGLVLELDAPVKKNLPISSTYVDQVMAVFSGGSL